MNSIIPLLRKRYLSSSWRSLSCVRKPCRQFAPLLPTQTQSRHWFSTKAQDSKVASDTTVSQANFDSKTTSTSTERGGNKDDADAAASAEAKYNAKLNSHSAVVPNEGSTARDHLANERTFLAWLRTSLTCIALSVPLHELLRISETPLLHFASAGSLLMSTGLLVFSAQRYYVNARLLQLGLFRINRRFVRLSP